MDSDGMLQTISSLKVSLPRVDKAPTASLSEATEFGVKQGFPMMLINGIFGMLMGWFNL